MHYAPDKLNENDRMEFTLWIGPLPLHWAAVIEQVNPQGFLDRQIRGPFQRWEHRHTFLPVAENVTEVRDEIQLQLRLHPVFSLIGFGMFISLPILFAYRAWKTRRLIEKPADQSRIQPAD